MDVLIIGAGPSGCVAASYLHNNNITVKVVEKNKFPRFVIGESLLPRCMDHFEEVGLLDVLKDFGFEIKEGARFLKDGIVCEFDFSKKMPKDSSLNTEKAISLLLNGPEKVENSLKKYLKDIL